MSSSIKTELQAQSEKGLSQIGISDSEAKKIRRMADRLGNCFQDFDDDDEWGKCQTWLRQTFNKRLSDPRLTAYQMLLFLPEMTITPATNTDPHAPEKIKNFYIASVAWLTSMHKGIPIKWLKTSPARELERHAHMLERRFNLLYGLAMWDNDFRRDFGKMPGYAFVLWEYAACWRALHLNVCTSKRGLYEQNKKHLKSIEAVTKPENLGNLDDFIEQRVSEEDDVLEWVKNIPDLIFTKAALLAGKDSKFNRLYFKPYLTKTRSWNSQVKNLKDEHFTIAV